MDIRMFTLSSTVGISRVIIDKNNCQEIWARYLYEYMKVQVTNLLISYTDNNFIFLTRDLCVLGGASW